MFILRSLGEREREELHHHEGTGKKRSSGKRAFMKTSLIIGGEVELRVDIRRHWLRCAHFHRSFPRNGEIRVQVPYGPAQSIRKAVYSFLPRGRCSENRWPSGSTHGVNHFSNTTRKGSLSESIISMHEVGTKEEFKELWGKH